MPRRRVGPGLVALGLLLLAAALVVRVLVAPALVKLPLDQRADPSAVGRDVDALVVETLTSLSGVPAAVQQTVRGDEHDEAAGDDVAVWEFTSEVSVPDGTVIREFQYRVCLDRRAAVAVDCASAAVNGEPTDIEGLTLTFPFGTGQQDYDWFNPATRATFPARFEGVEAVQGLRVYRFQVSVPETTILTRQVPGGLAGVPDQATVQADVVHSSERTMWVEPVSGLVVSVEEHPVTVVRGPGGERGVTVLAGDFAADRSTVDAGVARARDARGDITLVQSTVPSLLLGLGLAAALAGVLLTLRTRRAGPTPGAG